MSLFILGRSAHTTRDIERRDLKPTLRWVRPTLALALSASIIAGPVSAAQDQPSTPSTMEPAFEVASVRISHERFQDMMPKGGGLPKQSPGFLRLTGVTMRNLLGLAIGLRNFAEYQLRISGPSWIDRDRYDVLAKVPPDISRSEVDRMLLNLLIERFKLVVHHETKQLSAYELIVDKDGLKIKESTEASLEQPYKGPAGGHSKEGFPFIPAGAAGVWSAFRTVDGMPWLYLTAHKSSISQLVSTLMQPQIVEGLVVDKTGLTGRYDYTLHFEMDVHDVDPPGQTGSGGPTVFEAVREQLGLRLRHTKSDMDILFVDRGERVPLEN